jgi:hypothetical protein
MPPIPILAFPQNAAVEQAQTAADQAQMQAQMAADMARHQAEMSRDQAQMIRDAMRDAARAGGRPGTLMPPPFPDYASRRQQTFMFVGFIIVVIAAVAVLRPIMRAIGKRIEGAPNRDVLAGASTERLERIEQAVEAMAVEIERISEGQRFTTRLLSSRAEADAALVRRV